MKEWRNAQIEELQLKSTQFGPEITQYPDDSYVNDDGKRYTSFSGPENAVIVN